MKLYTQTFKDHKIVFVFFLFFIICQALFSSKIQYERSNWSNVPEAPARTAYVASFLGDETLAHRVLGNLLQNFGGSGGRFVAIGDYDMENVAEWLYLGNSLDPKSEYLPFLAAYFFGASQDKEKLRPIIAYLEEVGTSGGKEKWRWLVQGVILARFELKDTELALRLANKLASLWRPGMPAMMVQMPAFVQLGMGEKEASYQIMTELLREEAENMHPNEVNFMVDYICTRLLTETQIESDPLCVDVP